MIFALLSSFYVQIPHENKENGEIEENNCAFYFFFQGLLFPQKIMSQTICFTSFLKL